MRVIAGSARGAKLFAPAGLHTRPTADRVREAVFSALTWELPDSNFLDLFAGSGAIGVEALSRGAARAFFADNDEAAVTLTLRNLEKTRLRERAEVLRMDALSAIDEFNRRGVRFDIAYLDPPYGGSLIFDAAKALLEKGLIAENGLILLEISGKSMIQEEFLARELKFVDNSVEILKIKSYNIATVIFLKATSYPE